MRVFHIPLSAAVYQGCCKTRWLLIPFTLRSNFWSAWTAIRILWNVIRYTLRHGNRSGWVPGRQDLIFFACKRKDLDYYSLSSSHELNQKLLPTINSHSSKKTNKQTIIIISTCSRLFFTSTLSSSSSASAYV